MEHGRKLSAIASRTPLKRLSSSARLRCALDWGKAYRWTTFLPYGVLLSVWAYLRLQPTLALVPLDTADTPGYRLVASRSLSSLNFLVGIRPFTVPLLYKLAQSDTNIVACQAIIALLCWGLLALSIARAIRDARLKFVAFAGVLAFSLAEPIIRWDYMLLSESLSISLLAVLIACWFWLLEAWSRKKATLLLFLAFLWAFARDTNAYVLAMCALLIGVIIMVRRRQIHYLPVAAILLSIFIVVSTAADLSGRWVFPFLNVLMGRVLVNEQYTASLAQQGMPVTPELLAFAGKRAYSDDFGVYNEPALEGFRAWLFTHGKMAYLRFLATHPQFALGEPLAASRSLLDPDLAPNGEPDLTTPPQRILSTLVYSPGVINLVGWLALAVLVATYAGWRGRAFMGANWLVPLALLLFAWPLALVAWHGDAMDVGRHALQASVQLRLGSWLLLMLALNALFNARNENPANSSLG